jgi:membrane fusion protein (multidrug efflux system)
MATAPGPSSDTIDAPKQAPVEVMPTEQTIDPPAAKGGQPGQAGEGKPAATNNAPPGDPQPPAEPPKRPWVKRALLGAGVIGLLVGLYFLIPWVSTMLKTVSTDDAYVNGHVTFVAPRVGGQVKKVLVDDNNRVKKGDILVQLDKEPYQVQVNLKRAAVVAAERDLGTAKAQARGLVAQTRSNRYKLKHAIEDVKNQIANLGASVATLNSKKATLELSRSNLKRGEELAPGGGIGKEDLDQRRQAVKVDEANVEQALQTVYANRVSLGLPAQPPKGRDLADVPPDLDQDFSTVREALANTLQMAAQLGYTPTSWDSTPQQAIADFYKLDPQPAPGQDTESKLNRIYDRLIDEAPAVKQAEAKVAQAKDDLAQAELNLRYCDIVSDIDGVVTSRNVNPGNYVQTGQNLMAVRSLTEIWIDANFKETQLGDLRIGQRVRCGVDMYGSRREYEGRISGFTMGTGQTLALLPAQNATGNFVKIVQRLPVRIELTDYRPDQAPLFVGLSVTPYVYFKEPAAGPHAGEFLQPLLALPTGPTEPRP